MEKWLFFEQKNGLTPLEKCQFFAFLILVFLWRRKSFFISRISYNTFFWAIFAKKSLKNGDYSTKTIGEPLWKNLNFSTFWTCCFYSLEKRFFFPEYRKTHFPGLYCLKTKVGKMAIFRTKEWVNPSGKISILSTFWTYCFFSLESRSFSSRIS